MILQALLDYYERKRDAENGSLPDPGFQRKEIPFILVVSKSGGFVDIEDTRSIEGRFTRGRRFDVPHAVKRASNIKANLLWDNPDYVLGFPSGKSGSRAERQHESFVERIREDLGDVEDDGVNAVLSFLDRGEFDAVLSHPLWEEVLSANNGNMSFRMEGEHRLVSERPDVRAAIARLVNESEAGEAQCLVTGRREPIARLHPAIKGVRGARTMGANIVSFNQTAFTSHGHGKNDGSNAPVAEGVVHAYTTALNRLLSKDSRQKVTVGDTTIIFWAAEDHPIESLAAELLGGNAKTGDDPDRNVDAVRQMYSAPESGSPPLQSDRTDFYVLGLSPNSSRISIRLWQKTTVADLATRLIEHFDDISIDRPPKYRRYASVDALLCATAVQGDRKNISPTLSGEVLRSIITGQPYPRTLFSAAIERNRREQSVTPDRAAVIKGFLTRQTRLLNQGKKEVSVSLDVENQNTGYRLGRLFAAFEKIQEEAMPGVKDTVRTRYYSTASSAPVSVFPRLMSLKNHHVGKLESKGRQVYFERLIGEIVDGIDGFPSILAMTDQGNFGVGYYHQRQAFFAKRDDDEEETE